MRSILAAFVLALPVIACSADDPVAPIETTLTEGPREVVAVLSYASWCGSCKTLDPRIEAVKEAHDFQNVTFVTLDYTKKSEAMYFATAEATGVGPAIRERFGEEIFTGRMVLVDAATQELLGEIDKTMDAPAIYAALIDATLDR